MMINHLSKGKELCQISFFGSFFFTTYSGFIIHLKTPNNKINDKSWTFNQYWKAAHGETMPTYRISINISLIIARKNINLYLCLLFLHWSNEQWLVNCRQKGLKVKGWEVNKYWNKDAMRGWQKYEIQDENGKKSLLKIIRQQYFHLTI